MHIGSLGHTICGTIGIVGGMIAAALGGWDTAIMTLIIFMAVDYIMGVTIAAVFKKSRHSETGALESRAGWKGICRKCVTLLMVLIAAQLDNVLNTVIIRDMVIIAYIANELISIIENAGIMGVPIPRVILDAIELLKQKGEGDRSDDDPRTD